MQIVIWGKILQVSMQPIKLQQIQCTSCTKENFFLIPGEFNGRWKQGVEVRGLDVNIRCFCADETVMTYWNLEKILDNVILKSIKSN